MIWNKKQELGITEEDLEIIKIKQKLLAQYYKFTDVFSKKALD